MSKTDSDVEDLPLDSSKAPTTTTDGGTTTRTETEYEEGEETDEEGEEEAEEEEPEVYNSEDFISGPSWPKTSTIPENILVFEYAQLNIIHRVGYFFTFDNFVVIRLVMTVSATTTW